MRDPVWKLGFALAVFLGTAVLARHWLERGRVQTTYVMWTAPPQDDPRRLRWLETGAAAGHPPAMIGLAFMHERGWGGLDRDDEAAMGLLRRAAMTQDRRAMGLLGLKMLERAPAGSALSREGFGWLEKSAAAGDRWSMLNLGHAAQKGLYGRLEDWGEAARRYEAALKVWAGDSPTMVRLASLLEQGGPGLPEDRARALRLYEAAAAGRARWRAAEEARSFARRRLAEMGAAGG